MDGTCTDFLEHNTGRFYQPCLKKLCKKVFLPADEWQSAVGNPLLAQLETLVFTHGRLEAASTHAD
jgi:hypothetical protein